MRKDVLIDKLSEIGPVSEQEEWDNSGLQVYAGGPEVNKIMVALEISDDVITEAMNEGCEMIVTHHPLIFDELRSVDVRDLTGGYVVRLLRAGISVFSDHTPFDKMQGGNNARLGEILGIKDPEVSSGEPFLMTGELPSEMFFGDFIKETSEKLGIELRLLRAVGDPETRVKKAGWCTGSGGGFVRQAADLSCDVYITGDLKYHDARYAKEKGMCVLDAGHYGTEKIFVDNMAGILEKSLDAEIVRSKIDIDPFSW